MLHVTFNTYNNYVTDSLYQWDLNRRLIITGLDLETAPEIHFANSNMGGAIVKQSTIEDGVITVRIPNSLLQSSGIIKIYIGIYEGKSFNVIETIEIPVIARKRPNDYRIEDSDEELYSFRALENKINNIVAKGASARIADVSLLANAWIGNQSPYSQIVTIESVTPNTQVDLTPSIDQLCIFHNKDLAFVTENDDGVVTVYAIGQKPTNDYVIQATLTEVIV